MKNLIVRSITGVFFVAAIVVCFMRPIAMEFLDVETIFGKRPWVSRSEEIMEEEGKDSKAERESDKALPESSETDNNAVNQEPASESNAETGISDGNDNSQETK